MMIFLDFEASSIHAGSFPVEVGFCSHDLTRGWSAIIVPSDGWDEWSPASEQTHGLSRAMLSDHGLPADEVMARLNADLGTAACIYNPEFDARWLAKLSGASTAPATFSVEPTPLDALLVAAHGEAHIAPDGVHPLAAQVMGRHAGLQAHRALDDAIMHALRLGAVAAAAMERDHGPAAAATFRRELIERARRLLQEHGRPSPTP